MNIEMEFDIRAAADQIKQLFQSGRGAKALELLENHGETQSQVIQESLDRFVAVQALGYLQSSGAGEYPGRTASLERLALVAMDPRFPQSQEMAQLASDAQRHDVYASIIMSKGSVAANDALDANERVILGLRNETSTVASSDPQSPGVAAADDLTTRRDDESRKGTGVYDDRLIVLWKGPSGTRNLVVAELASTEPSAQYDAHARSRPGRSETPFSHVKWRRAEGQDVDGDGIADLGRLADGTFELQAATHPNAPSEGGTHFSLRPSPRAVRSGAGSIERDTNADGWFTEADANGRQDLNSTFKIHKGSRHNTDSAGCQTIHPDDYPDFIDAVEANPLQTRWQYVLTSTITSGARELQIDGEREERERGSRHRELRDDFPQLIPHRPDDPRHPDHALLLQIRGIVRTRDGAEAADESRDERLSRALLPLAVDSGMTRVDHLMAHGGRLFMVQGQLHDPASRHASIDTDVALRTGVEQSDRQLEEVHRRIGTLQAQQQGMHRNQVQADETLSRRV